MRSSLECSTVLYRALRRVRIGYSVEYPRDPSGCYQQVPRCVHKENPRWACKEPRTGAQQLRIRLTGASRSHVEVDTPTAARQRYRVAATWVAGLGLAALIGLPSGGRSNLAGALGFDANVVGGAFVAAQRANTMGPCTNRPCRLGQRCLTCAARRPRSCWRSNTRADHVTQTVGGECNRKLG